MKPDYSDIQRLTNPNNKANDAESHDQDETPALLSVAVDLTNPDPDQYRAFTELLGKARYENRPLRLYAELPLTDQERQAPPTAALNPRPAYYSVNPRISGPVDFNRDPDLLTALMFHLENLTGWQILQKHYPEYIPAEKLHRFYQLAAANWVEPDPDRPGAARLRLPPTHQIITEQLDAVGVQLTDLYPEIEKPEAEPQPEPEPLPLLFANAGAAPTRCLQQLTEDDFIVEYQSRVTEREEDSRLGTDSRPPLPPWADLPERIRENLLHAASEYLRKHTDWDELEAAVLDAVAAVDERTTAAG